jgi:hypothetical protein
VQGISPGQMVVWMMAASFDLEQGKMIQPFPTTCVEG